MKRTVEMNGKISSDETPASSLANDDDIDGLEVTLYSECVKLKGFTYYEHFQEALKSCKLKQLAGQEILLKLQYLMNQQMWLMKMLLWWKCNNMMENGHPLATPQRKSAKYS